METITLDQVVELALKLTRAEQEALVLQISTNVHEHTGEAPAELPAQQPTTWGEQALTILADADTSGWEAIPDVEAWVKNMREDGLRKRGVLN